MTSGIRARLFLASIAVVLAVLLPLTLVVRGELDDWAAERARTELTAWARAAADTGALDALGQDSGVQLDRIPGDDEQPEARDARARGTGFSRRGGRAYVAIALPDGTIIRASRSLDQLDDATRLLYSLLGIIALTAVAGAIGTSWLAGAASARTLSRLAVTARAMAAGGTERVAPKTDDALGALGRALDAMADGTVRANEALAHERGLLGSLLDAIGDGIVTVDGWRRITMVNDAARRLLELEGAPVGEALLDHVRVPGIVGLLPPSPPGQAELQMPSGTRLVARTAPLRGGGYLLTVEDVTAVRKLETVRRDFVANVSHELRTPVSIIRANAETLIGGAKDEPAIASRLLDGVHRNAERLARILTDLLDLSRLEAGSYRIETTTIDVRAAAEQAVAALGTDKPIEIVVPAELAVRGDARALDQVLVNLLDNAVKYGGRAWVDARRRGDRVRIEIKDDGPGIAARHRERIFERFYRVDPGRSREIGGTGLGLSIVKHLVETMAGDVGVEANEPRGSIFWLELPAA